MRTKKIIIGIVAVSVLTFGGLWAAAVTAKAQADSLGQSLAGRVADRFGLNADEVQDVFDDFRQERFAEQQQEMRERMEKNLGEAVANRVITEDLKQMLVDKKQEMFQAHQRLQEEWHIWARESGIDFETLREYGVRGIGMGFKGKGRMRGWGCI